MAQSATLNVGQFGTSMKSTTSPRRNARRADHPVDQVPERPAEHEGQRVGHDDVGRPPGRADDVAPTITTARTASTGVSPVRRLKAPPGFRVRRNWSSDADDLDRPVGQGARPPRPW